MAETRVVGRRRWAIGLLLGAGILINSELCSTGSA